MASEERKKKKNTRCCNLGACEIASSGSLKGASFYGVRARARARMALIVSFAGGALIGAASAGEIANLARVPVRSFVLC